jgi:phage repressor protein C with HTH and peptisase S24 domain
MGDAAEVKALQARLDQVLKKFGSVGDLAREIGVSDNAIYKWLSGRGQPSVANLVALARASKVSIEWLATGHETSSGQRAPRRPAPETDEFIYVARHQARIGAGGSALRSDQVVDYLAFKREWVRARLNTDSRNLMLIEALGDAMSPTIDDRDLLLVDLGEPHFRHDGAYVLRRENDLEVRRLQRRPDGTLNVICDNNAYPQSVVATDSIHIIGRVIWVAGRI